MISRLPGATPTTRVCKILGASRATLYRRRRPRLAVAKRGPKTSLSDAGLADAVRDALEDRAKHGFVGEGHRKVLAQLRFTGIRVGRPRLLRVMREHELLAPTRPSRRRGPYVHDGRISTDLPDQMWGTDATMAHTRAGWAWVFIAVDHCTSECIGIHSARPGTRYEALEPIYQGVREHFGDVADGVAAGLKIRHDHGSQYISNAFQGELEFLGIESSPSFIGAPEGNGVAERFIRTLKEQLLWLQVFDDVEHLRQELLDFRERYNAHWMVEKHGHASPSEARRKLLSGPQAAAA